jgi:hypothetical protein
MEDLKKAERKNWKDAAKDRRSWKDLHVHGSVHHHS